MKYLSLLLLMLLLLLGPPNKGRDLRWTELANSRIKPAGVCSRRSQAGAEEHPSVRRVFSLVWSWSHVSVYEVPQCRRTSVHLSPQPQQLSRCSPLSTAFCLQKNCRRHGAFFLLLPGSFMNVFFTKQRACYTKPWNGSHLSVMDFFLGPFSAPPLGPKSSSSRVTSMLRLLSCRRTHSPESITRPKIARVLHWNEVTSLGPSLVPPLGLVYIHRWNPSSGHTFNRLLPIYKKSLVEEVQTSLENAAFFMILMEQGLQFIDNEANPARIKPSRGSMWTKVKWRRERNVNMNESFLFWKRRILPYTHHIIFENYGTIGRERNSVVREGADCCVHP